MAYEDVRKIIGKYVEQKQDCADKETLKEIDSLLLELRRVVDSIRRHQQDKLGLNRWSVTPADETLWSQVCEYP
jgi:hypothetical protein